MLLLCWEAASNGVPVSVLMPGSSWAESPYSIFRTASGTLHSDISSASVSADTAKLDSYLGRVDGLENTTTQPNVGPNMFPNELKLKYSPSGRWSNTGHIFLLERWLRLKSLKTLRVSRRGLTRSSGCSKTWATHWTAAGTTTSP